MVSVVFLMATDFLSIIVSEQLTSSTCFGQFLAAIQTLKQPAKMVSGNQKENAFTTLVSTILQL